MCMTCGKKLEWFELIPVVSFLIQHGRCRDCHSHISEQYVLVEFFTAILFLLAGVFLWKGIFMLMPILSFVLILAIVSVLIAIFVYDYLHKIIPDPFVVALVVIGFLQISIQVFYYGEPMSLFLNTLINGLVLFIPFFILWSVSNGRWIGLGDGKLAFAIGIILPLSSAVSAIILSFWVGALAGLIYMYSNKLKGNTEISHAIPFGPFMVLGTIIVLFYPLDLLNIVLLSEYVKTIL